MATQTRSLLKHLFTQWALQLAVMATLDFKFGITMFECGASMIVVRVILQLSFIRKVEGRPALGIVIFSGCPCCHHFRVIAAKKPAQLCTASAQFKASLRTCFLRCPCACLHDKYAVIDIRQSFLTFVPKVHSISFRPWPKLFMACLILRAWPEFTALTHFDNCKSGMNTKRWPIVLSAL